MADGLDTLFSADAVVGSQQGPLYLRLKTWIENAVQRGAIRPGDALPSERDLASRVEMSRVTVRKAVQHLVRDGILVQRHGSGTYVASQPNRVEQSLSQLTSFTEDMARRGLAVRSIWLDRGLFAPSPEEIVTLGLPAGENVARISRLRIAGDTPLAIERATLSAQFVPDPQAIETSLYAYLGQAGNRPVRAIQRIRAVSIGEEDARLFDVPAHVPGLHIERTSYLASGRVVEFTRSVYRGDAYDFVAELRLGGGR
jgi:GntR family transcriptional regulator, N-acetylglucosamine utilization regulator